VLSTRNCEQPRVIFGRTAFSRLAVVRPCAFSQVCLFRGREHFYTSIVTCVRAEICSTRTSSDMRSARPIFASRLIVWNCSLAWRVFVLHTDHPSVHKSAAGAQPLSTRCFSLCTRRARTGCARRETLCLAFESAARPADPACDGTT